MQKGREDSISITRLLLVVSLGPIYLGSEPVIGHVIEAFP